MNQRRQWALALLLLAVLAVLLGRQLTGEESLLGPRGEQPNAELPFGTDEVPVVVLASPGPRPGETFERERVDIFRYEESPAEAEARRRAERERLDAERKRREAEAERARLEKARRDAEEAERRRLEAERLRREALERQRQSVEVEPEPVVAEKPVPPEFPYRFDGLIGPKADAIAILRDREDDFAYARAGQVLDQAFRVERVGQLKLVLSFTDPLFAGEFRQVPLRLDGADSGSRPTARR